MTYTILEKLLTQVNQNATVCGKYWFVILYTCRIVLTGAIANPVYSDEQSSFKCNTLQVGCENVCFNQISPMSQIRFWTVQIIFTCAPTVIFILWAINSVHCMNALIDRIMNEREDHRRCTMLSVAGMTMTRSSSVSSDFSILDEKRRMRVIQDEIETIVDQLPSILLGYVVQSGSRSRSLSRFFNCASTAFALNRFTIATDGHVEYSPNATCHGRRRRRYSLGSCSVSPFGQF